LGHGEPFYLPKRLRVFVGNSYDVICFALAGFQATSYFLSVCCQSPVTLCMRSVFVNMHRYTGSQFVWYTVYWQWISLYEFCQLKVTKCHVVTTKWWLCSDVLSGNDVSKTVHWPVNSVNSTAEAEYLIRKICD